MSYTIELPNKLLLCSTITDLDSLIAYDAEIQVDNISVTEDIDTLFYTVKSKDTNNANT